ncbi:hypothetical protein PHLCEN_2v7173 [Hermanssonia centrifuga]|uniref:ABC protein n=1 Tax=Hermanssonia centrifuga TaxID=98765 RepID=A0A2R6NX90_9APHY|nr:hypothetical protein PHLCEN_2v7173 [Hermanssonia centrifuga]
MSEKDCEKDTDSVLTKEVGDKDASTLPKGREAPKLVLDSGEERVRYRRQWWQMWLPKDPPPPAPATFEDAPITPLATASIFSMLSYSWITPIMTLGYQRTLQATDLWKLDESREAAYLSTKLDESWARRVENADIWNARLAKGEIRPGLLKRTKWFFQAMKNGSGYSERRQNLEQYWRDVDGRKEASLAWALNDTFGFSFWLGGLFKVFGDTSQLMGPLLVKAIINFGKDRAAATQAGKEPPGLGRGAGMAVGLFCITVFTSVMQHQFFWRSMTTGLLARAALISSIYKRGVNMTGKARTGFPNSALVNHISTDLGPSALAGFSLFFLMIPLQERLMAIQFKIRKRSNKWTDLRAKIIHEVLGAMRVVKYFSYEIPFLEKIFETRLNELAGIRTIQFARSANIAFAFSVPVLAATLAFVTYTLTAHDFNVAIIFSSFSLFQLLRQPLMFMPRALSATTDAQNALVRLTKVFQAPLMDSSPFTVNPGQKMALEVRDATFEWEESLSVKEAKEAKAKAKKKGKDAAAVEAEVEDSPPFQMRNVTMLVPRGSLVAIVGAVGSGKSSLLNGLIGEMRKVQGHVSFGGSVAYCAQTAWIQNATLRENITFGQPFEEDRYWKAVENSSLLPDLQVLADGDLTEIGEKGINLSGGQKQRVNIARALYHDSEVVIFDDPLSAVDAHVGRALFSDAILGALRSRGKTVILVTHALHFLSQCDYVYTLGNGKIEAEGKYQDLVNGNASFSALMTQFGGETRHEEEVEEEESAMNGISDKQAAIDEAKLKSESKQRVGAGTGKLEGRLIVAEKRSTGSVSWKVYGAYLQAGKAYWTMPFLVIFMVAMQTSSIINSYTLVWWQANTWDRPNSFYQVLYAGLGISQAVFTLFVGIAMDEMGYFVSQNMHHSAIKNIFYAPMSFFDTTPLADDHNLTTDIDNQLPVIAVVVLGVGYTYFAAFYRESAREMKRLDSMLRSFLYAHFAESLSGLPTIRSYGEISRFLSDNEYYTDLEDRAAFLTVTNQRWLAIRLDFLGGIMTFVVAILAVVGVSGINPAQIGLVLTYTTSLTQMCGVVTRQSAEVENYMASVETVVHYSHGGNVVQEAPHEIEDKAPAADWPKNGAIEFKDIVMRYRPGLPYVLKGLSLSIKGGEKIGVVGSNLDPFSVYDDVRLWDALRRSYLVESTDKDASSEGKDTAKARFTLDTIVEGEGANLSVGERSLLSLARALAKDSKVVDRLRTIISYDRILVLDAGTIAEFDTPLNLFIKDGIFRGMCDRSNISIDDIHKASLASQV